MSLSVLVPQVDIRRVDLCAVANVPTLSGTGGTLDGVTIQAGMVLLLTAQTDPAQNGAWLVPASGAWRQSAFPGQDRYFLVGSGSAQAGTLWRIQGAPKLGVWTQSRSRRSVSRPTSSPASWTLPTAGPAWTGPAWQTSRGSWGTGLWGSGRPGAPAGPVCEPRCLLVLDPHRDRCAPKYPHGLGQIPSATRAWLVEVPAGGANISGSVDATNATYTVTSGARYQFLCEL
jgi:hypothetical protein